MCKINDLNPNIKNLLKNSKIIYQTAYNKLIKLVVNFSDITPGLLNRKLFFNQFIT